MPSTIKQAILGILVAAFSAISGFFLYNSKFEVIKLASFSSLKETALKILQADFLLFVLFSALTLAVINAISIKAESKKTAYLLSFPGLLAGIAVTLVLSQASTEKIFLSIFLLIATAILIETAFLKKQEFKKFISFRTAGSASQKAIFIIAVGLFVSTGFIVYSHQSQFVKDFENETMKLALSQTQGNGSSSFADTTANAIVQMEKQTITQVTQTSQFQKLETKQDTDVQEFVLMVKAMQGQIDSPQTKELIKQQIQNNISTGSKLISFDTIKNQVPFLKQIEDFYWLIVAFSITSVFLIFANLIIANLAAFFAAVFSKLLENQSID